ncbi:ComEA family DNA-binding protein [Glycomyces buryatensis]|uniref:Helix-hairpin-helix domain-containing protein n=1 Tax=Glycomyces buryatensis TaxID=2570927 RepID=A0A4S8QHB0_9ACTN|nr:helix-hairpin-helix domain-containing protein [Glycomyces buryatensis]THV40789.1 helix-hairpin-helix domain-containing protein [Glycomyces buryatensis]
MTASGPYVPPTNSPKRTTTNFSRSGTILWALLPLLTCGLGTPIAFAIALSRRRTTNTLIGLIVYSATLIAACGIMGSFGDQAPSGVDAMNIAFIGLGTLGATGHLFVIRPSVWEKPARPQVPVARLEGTEVVDRARHLREQARRTVDADPMLAKRLGIGRPDLPRQFDDGGLVDLNHAPAHVLAGLPGVTITSARQIQDWVARSGPFGSLGEVLLVIEISPTFEHHLREYVVFIP